MSGFFGWWLGELRAVLPAVRTAPRLPARFVLVDIRADGLRVHLHERGGAVPLPGRDAGAAVSIEALARTVRHGLPGRLRIPIVARVAWSDCLVRAVDLPAAAHRDFHRMLWLDLERTTPLKASGMLGAYVVDGPGARDGLLRVRHLLVKSRTVAPVLAELRAAGLEPAVIDCWSEDGSAPMPVRFFAPQSPLPAARGAALARAAAVLAGVLALSALAIAWGKQEVALATLTAETARLQAGVRDQRQAAELQRAASAEAERLHGMKALRVPSTLILEEVTRLLPDSAWLQELRLDNDVLEIAGLAASASSLLPGFEASALFHETAFIAPLRTEPGGSREQFRLRARLRSAARSATDGSGEAGR